MYQVIRAARAMLHGSQCFCINLPGALASILGISYNIAKGNIIYIMIESQSMDRNLFNISTGDHHSLSVYR